MPQTFKEINPAILNALVCISFLPIWGCKTAQNGTSSLERVQYADANRKDGESYTDARVASLNAWADELLSAEKDSDDISVLAKDYFKRAGVKDADPMSRYKIRLRSSMECFQEKWFGNNIYWDSQRDAMRKQIESAALFLLDFHKATLGRPRGAFALREIEICPEHIVGSAISLKGQTLVIGVPRTTAGSYSPLSSDLLRRKWDLGDHLDNEESRSLLSKTISPVKIRALWMLFNPSGTVRTSLRLTIAEQGAGILRKFEPWARALGLKVSGPSRSGEAGAVSVAGTIANPEQASEDLVRSVILTSVDPKRIGMESESIKTAVQGLAKSGKINLLLQNWTCAARDQSYADEMATSALGSFEQVFKGSKSKAAIEIEAGLVAVGNYHKIGVTFAGGAGSFENFIQKPDVTDDQLELKVKVKSGLVSVFTVDEINVQASVGVLKEMTASSIESLAFKMALTATAGGVDLCK